MNIVIEIVYGKEDEGQISTACNYLKYVSDRLFLLQFSAIYSYNYNGYSNNIFEF